MDLTKLTQTVRSQIRSEMMMNNISRCITDLVENAIDAEATCVAIKLNLPKFKIQVVDNGNGMKKEHLNLVGTRYCTTKCNDSSHSKKFFNQHDHRGESLATIKNSCSRMMIVSRAAEDDITYCKIFDESKTETVVEAVHQRVAKGTTVIINNIFGNFPVRQKRIVPSVEIQNTKRCILGISLMHPSILFILKDDAKNAEILRIQRTSSTLKTFRALFPQAIPHHSSMIKIIAEDDNISMKAMICREAQIGRQLQFVYVNKRYMIKSDIRSLLNGLLSKKGFFEGVSKSAYNNAEQQQQQPQQQSTISKMHKNAIFILNICCPPDEYDVTFLPDRRHVDFKHRVKIQHCLIKLVDSFWKLGAFRGGTLLQNDGVASSKKTRAFIPKLLFEKLNSARTIRGLPAYRRVAAADIGLNDVDNADIDIQREHKPICEAPSVAILGKSEETDQYSEDEEICYAEEEFTNQPASEFTPSTPLYTRLSEEPILSTHEILSRRNPQHTSIIDFVKNDTCSSVLNTSKIFVKLQNVTARAPEMEDPASNMKSLFSGKTTCQIKCIPSSCIKTNSNIRLYEIKKKYHLGRKKTSSETFLSNSLPKSKSKANKPNILHLKREQRKNDDFELSRLKPLIKKAVLQISDAIYESKNQSPNFIFNPTLLTQTKKCANDDPTIMAQFNLLLPQREKWKLNSILDVTNQRSWKLNQMKSATVPEIISKTSLSFRRPTLTSADFLCAANLNEIPKTFATSEKIIPHPFHSEFDLLSEQIRPFSPEIFPLESKTTQLSSVKTNFQSKEVAHLSEEPFQENLHEFKMNIKKWFPGVHHSVFHNPPLNSDGKAENEDVCQIPLCPCKCHQLRRISKNSSSSLFLSSIFDDTLSKSVTPSLFSSCSPQLFNQKSVEAKTSKNSENNCYYSTSVRTNNNAVAVSDTITRTQIGSSEIFSELTEKNAVTRDMEVCQHQNSCMSPLPIENIDVDQNELEIPFFSSSSDKRLGNERTFGSSPVYDDQNFPPDTFHQCNNKKSNEFEHFFNRLNMFCDDSKNNFNADSDAMKNIRLTLEGAEETIFNSTPAQETIDGCTELANNYFCMDLGKCSVVNPIPSSTGDELDNLKATEEIRSANYLFMEKMQYKRKSKFLDFASVFDIPKGILDVQNTKSVSSSFKKSEVTELKNLIKPCYMKNHLTIDDCGNSCLRIFPLLKKINNCSDGGNLKLDHGFIQDDMNCSILFSKMDLKSVEFLAQLDQKFLLASLTMSDTLDQIIVMFDQHAVDERIRVERLSKEYLHGNGVWRSVSVKVPLYVRVSRSEISIIVDFQKDFHEKGLAFDFSGSKENSEDQLIISVIRVPLCLYNRAAKESSKTNFMECVKQLSESLIKELIITLIRTRGISRCAKPQVLQNIINSEACRGAVKFGQQLSSNICTTLLQSLWSCNLPFQCAHGRPLLTPLVNIAKLTHIEKRKLSYRTFNELKIQLLYH